MTMKNTLILSLAILSFTLLILLGCQGNQSGNKAAGGSDEERGRVIQPTVTDGPQGQETGTATPKPPSGNIPSNYSNMPRESNTPSPNQPLPNPRLEAGINIALLIDGTQQDIQAPVYAHDGEQKQIEFVINATGSELATFHIESGAPADIPRDGELVGYQSNIPYIFTYFSRTWGEEGIIISVTNKQGDVSMANIFITNPQDPLH